ncbi:hypothetical protein Nepgr_022984 [Nepenthes gracilis]|uniref:Uncharacterized protein n=1 Tax=Nepenthes gracilis TaxID=150966 RepID=A0AAD3T1U4_NEPGR|nr:hypothetical protein Nepgr_022984 [Nepenthes gracilis]
MASARSPPLSPCSPQSGAAAHCSSPVRPFSPVVHGSISASISSQSAPFGESAHSDYLPGAVEGMPNNSSTAGSPGKPILPPGISWAQVAKAAMRKNTANLHAPPSTGAATSSSTSQKKIQPGVTQQFFDAFRLLTGAAELALSVENQKYAPLARDYGVERKCAVTCLPSDLVPRNEGGGGQSAHLVSPSDAILSAPPSGLVDGLGVGMEVNDLSPTGAILPAPASGYVNGLGVGMEVKDLGPIVAPFVDAGGTNGPLVLPNVVQHVLDPSSCSLDTPESIARITRMYSSVDVVEESLITAPAEFPAVISSPVSGCPVEGSEASLAGAVLPCDLERGVAHALPMTPSKQELCNLVPIC